MRVKQRDEEKEKEIKRDKQQGDERASLRDRHP